MMNYIYSDNSYNITVNIRPKMDFRKVIKKKNYALFENRLLQYFHNYCVNNEIKHGVSLLALIIIHLFFQFKLQSTNLLFRKSFVYRPR